MTPYRQLQSDDCFRTALGCLLSIAPATIPHFYDPARPLAEAERLIDEWLRARGLTRIEIPFRAVGHPQGSLRALLATMQAYNRGQPFILGGTSRNGTGHAVICRDGEIIHDPSSTKAGIVGPMSDGNYLVTFIGVVLPSAPEETAGEMLGQNFSKYPSASAP